MQLTPVNPRSQSLLLLGSGGDVRENIASDQDSSGDGVSNAHMLRVGGVQVRVVKARSGTSNDEYEEEDGADRGEHGEEGVER